MWSIEVVEKVHWNIVLLHLWHIPSIQLIDIKFRIKKISIENCIHILMTMMNESYFEIISIKNHSIIFPIFSYFFQQLLLFIYTIETEHIYSLKKMNIFFMKIMWFIESAAQLKCYHDDIKCKQIDKILNISIYKTHSLETIINYWKFNSIRKKLLTHMITHHQKKYKLVRWILGEICLLKNNWNETTMNQLWSESWSTEHKQLINIQWINGMICLNRKCKIEEIKRISKHIFEFERISNEQKKINDVTNIISSDGFENSYKSNTVNMFDAC